TRRADVTFGIDYDDDMDKAIAVIKQVIEADDRIFRDPEPFVKVVNLGDSSVDIATRSWVQAADVWDVKFHLMKAVKEAFDREGISIPYPHQVEIQKQAAND
ncbi:MAG TPA: mechanosensitive ion channel protein MscS, partial [Hyphomonas sp.]|nr:mechanosensitive ion channel protein MscS [Hyphomonas sp.]